MRDLAMMAFIVALLVLAFWWGWTRTRDKYQICRQLGHGAFYCVFAATENK